MVVAMRRKMRFSLNILFFLLSLYHPLAPSPSTTLFFLSYLLPLILFPFPRSLLPSGRAETADRNRPLLAAPDGMGPPRPFDRESMMAMSDGGRGFDGVGGGRGFDGGFDNFGPGSGRMQMDFDDRGRVIR